MTLLSSWLAGSGPEAAVEITAQAVSMAAVSVRGADIVVDGYGVDALPPGSLTASLTATNIADRAAVRAALESVLGRLGRRVRRVGLILPDVTARVSLLRFDRIPVRSEDLDQLVRWQIKKSAPFPVEDACVTYSLATRMADGGGEYLVVAARRDIVREYESICEDIGLYPGLVDLSTLSIVNLFLASAAATRGDWLVVHMRPEYTSLVIMRGTSVIFFRSRPESDDDALADEVHQTTMYYQDRLAGQGFARVFLGGVGRVPAALETARRDLEARIGTAVDPIDPMVAATFTDRISSTPELSATLAPLVGTLVRARKETVSA